MIQCNVCDAQRPPAMKRLFLMLNAFAGATALTVAFANAEVATLNWQDLLPDARVKSPENSDVPAWERVRVDLDKKDVRIPGFIVPLEYDDQQVVTRFLLVPYFGACIHEPPPAPNQTIYAEFEAGYKLESMWSPVWIEGKIHTSRVEEDLATAAYTLSASKIEPY